MTVGVTAAEPVAAAEVKVPGVMLTLVAPVVTQLKVLLTPELTLPGIAVNDVIVGLVRVVTVTVVVAVVDPAPFVAVSV
ncbi:MAG: hypothetical protein WBE13_05780 [Candidatus Acidiferrum sp.]